MDHVNIWMEGFKQLRGLKSVEKGKKKKKKKKKEFTHNRTRWLPRPMLAGYFVYRLSA
jgi:hypothetical protein